MHSSQGILRQLEMEKRFDNETLIPLFLLTSKDTTVVYQYNSPSYKLE